MSKRYGRNQKRRHREEVARLETSLAIERASTRAAHDQTTALQRRLRRSVEVVGSFGRDMIEPSVYLARVDLHGPADTIVIQRRVSDLAVREALYSSDARRSIANMIAEIMYEDMRP